MFWAHCLWIWIWTVGLDFKTMSNEVHAVGDKVEPGSVDTVLESVAMENGVAAKRSPVKDLKVVFVLGMCGLVVLGTLHRLRFFKLIAPALQ